MDEIKLHFFRSNNGELNFGDELSPLIVNMVSGGGVSRSPISKCDMISLGSILEGANKRIIGRKMRFKFSPIHVWGSGLILDSEVNIKKYQNNFIFHSVRGELTRGHLGLGDLPLGDPGLLSQHLVAKQKKSIEMLILPHIAHRDRDEIKQISQSYKNSIVADLSSDPMEILRMISASKKVISSSLHGLICADSMGVSNIRLDLGTGLKGGDFKFNDYDTSINRVTPSLTGHEGGAEINALFDATDYGYHNNIDKICNDLIAAFPSHLKRT